MTYKMTIYKFLYSKHYYKMTSEITQNDLQNNLNSLKIFTLMQTCSPSDYKFYPLLTITEVYINIKYNC